MATPVAAVNPIAGDGQSAALSTAFAVALKVQVVGPCGELLSGLTVNFTAPSSGASATFPDGASAVTNAQGIATVNASANGTAGSYQVTATTAGIPGIFGLTNTQSAETAQTIVFGPLGGRSYGAAAFGISATATSQLAVSFASTTSSVCTASGTTVTIVAAGPCSITASQSGDASYSPAPNVIQGFTVSKATLTVTAQNATITYPAASPAFSANITGFVDSDLSTVVTGSPAFLNSAATTNGKPNAGTWIITPSAGSLAASNYTFSYVNGTLTVNGSPLTVTATNASKTYGTTFAATAFTTSGLLSGDSVSTVTLFSSGAAGAAPVAGSPYSIVPSAAIGTGLANYAISYVNGTLTVNRAALTVTANNASRAYGAANPTLSAVIAGFVNGETSAVVTGAPALSTAAVPLSSGGAYPITPAAGTLSAANYTFGFVNGTLTISTARTSIWLTAAPTASVYGQPVLLTATVGSATMPPGLALPIGQVSFSVGGTATLALGTTSVTETTLSVGTYSITAQYNGDSTWPSASGAISVTVSPAFTATALSLKMVSGQLTLVAAITPVAPGAGIATGIVRFVNTSNNTMVASAGLSSGNATANVSTSVIGLPIVAVYGGDANFKGSTSATLPALVNAATNLSAIFAPDEVVSLFNVTGLSGNTSGALPLTTSLGGVTVTVTDSAGVARPAQLYGVFGSARQINFVIPSATGSGPATVTITLPSSAMVTTVIQVAVAAPGIFTANMNGQGVYTGQVVYASPDGSQIIASSAVMNPATNQYVPNPISLSTPGQQAYLVLYGTGIRHAGSLTAAINGVNLPLFFFGAQGQYPGLDQINLQVPSILAGSGLVNLVITVGGQAANTVTVVVE